MKEHTAEEELADLEDQQRNIERRIEQLRAIIRRREKKVIFAEDDPRYLAWRERRIRER